MLLARVNCSSFLKLSSPVEVEAGDVLEIQQHKAHRRRGTPDARAHPLEQGVRRAEEDIALQPVDEQLLAVRREQLDLSHAAADARAKLDPRYFVAHDADTAVADHEQQHRQHQADADAPQEAPQRDDDQDRHHHAELEPGKPEPGLDDPFIQQLQADVDQ